MGGAEVPTAADHEGRWQGRSHRSSASVDGLITASVGIDTCELPEAGPTSVVEFCIVWGFDTRMGIPERVKESKGLIDDG